MRTARLPAQSLGLVMIQKEHRCAMRDNFQSHVSRPVVDRVCSVDQSLAIRAESMSMLSDIMALNAGGSSSRCLSDFGPKVPQLERAFVFFFGRLPTLF